MGLEPTTLREPDRNLMRYHCANQADIIVVMVFSTYTSKVQIMVTRNRGFFF